MPSGVYKRDPIVPKNSDPWITRLFREMAAKGINANNLARKASVSPATVTAWGRSEGTAKVENLEACLNVVGLTLRIVPLHDRMDLTYEAISDFQLLERLDRDNVAGGARPVIESQGWEQALRLSDDGLIAIEQIGAGGRLHITRKGSQALHFFRAAALAATKS